MLISPQPNDVKAITVEPRPIEVVISEDGVSPLSLVMPPYEDMAEIQMLQGTHFSIKEFSSTFMKPMWDRFRAERARLRTKQDKYGQSQTYFNRLANLAALTGDHVEEESNLRQALELKGDEFIGNRLVENMLALNRIDEAKVMLEHKDLDKSVYANLRLAALYAVRDAVPQAAEHVANALRIDPLDFGARLFDGALRVRGGDYENAILSFRIARERRPNSAALHTNLAVAYVRVNRKDKALRCLKMAVAIDPLSANAVLFLADLTHALGRSEEAVPSLRYFIRYEQKFSPVWGRLARALRDVGEHGEAIAALKRQASIENKAEIWNNLGVAYHGTGDDRRALESFKHAMTLAKEPDDYWYCLGVTNAAVILSSTARPAEIVAFIDKVVEPRNFGLFASRRELASLFVLRLHALVRDRRSREAAKFGEEILTWKGVNPELVYRTAVGLMSLYALSLDGAGRALELAKQFSEQALNGRFEKSETRHQLLNNIAFVYAESNDLHEAERHLQAISDRIHKDAYPTATSGLLHLKRGHSERANQLYGEALRLAVSKSDKTRIRQKWNLEMGKLLVQESPSKGLRLLQKAREEEEGEEGIAAQASVIINSLRP